MSKFKLIIISVLALLFSINSYAANDNVMANLGTDLVAAPSGVGGLEPGRPGPGPIPRITVVSASWGVEDVNVISVTQIIASRCNGETRCGLSPNNDGWLGRDPAVGYSKMLTVFFKCGADPSTYRSDIRESIHWFIHC